MQKLKLIVVDSDEENCLMAKEQLDTEEIEVVGIASNGLECLEILKEVQADVVLTELMMPVMDGYLLMDNINKDKELKNKLKVFVMTGMKSEEYLTAALKKNAMYCFFKPVDYETMGRTIVNKIDDLPLWQSWNHKEKAEEKKSEKAEKEAGQILDEKIAKIFISIGIPAHIKGYHYLRYAIKEVIVEPAIINGITKQLYPNVAERFSSSPSKVERAIRHAIEVAWSRGKIDNINKLFGFKVYGVNDKPTNGEFIALVADKLMCEIND